MSPTVLPTVRRQEGVTGRHVLWACVGFFGVVLAVNFLMLYWALATHSGMVAQEPYRKGLAYNERIAADERQSALGWKDAVSLEADGRVSVMLADEAGAPVMGLILKGQLGRPATQKGDVVLAFAEEAPGSYRATTGPLAGGAWRLDIEGLQAAAGRAGTGAETVLRLRRRLWLKP